MTPDLRVRLMRRLRSVDDNDTTGFIIYRGPRDHLYARCTTFIGGFKTTSLILKWSKHHVTSVTFKVVCDAFGTPFNRAPCIPGICFYFKQNLNQLDLLVKERLGKSLHVEIADIVFSIYKKAISIVRVLLFSTINVTVYRGSTWDQHCASYPVTKRDEKMYPLNIDPLFRIPCVDMPFMVDKLVSEIWREMMLN